MATQVLMETSRDCVCVYGGTRRAQTSLLHTCLLDIAVCQSKQESGDCKHQVLDSV